ncbi:Uma2 family endonuclease [Pseudonocardia abyssalis]|uniref:Uma2 family endonuclease n=1 Tax=Pseudonocardia abyssalis TaxID=2792008 RepID=A0ABS6V1T5_9PSEU|nr:Uma2 family endonuclease [Pseudonocardia abyssalis]MBW0115160.1 Uma2 family endonuclease [Pseudonocardia abyssalis]MBW0138468.1 Uma2 family endonuclease [Pseudonocardia abyssalis]
MTALPLPRPRLLTAAGSAALDEATDGRYEPQDGTVVMSPSPVPRHQACQGELMVQLRGQVPSHDIETLSPGSRRTDRTVKRAEYPDARIPHYWILDITDGVGLVECHHLAGEFGYADAGPVTGRCTTDDPFPARIDLDVLLA